MKAISELPKRGAPISTADGASWHSGRGPALENAIGRLQTWIRKPVIRRMSAERYRMFATWSAEYCLSPIHPSSTPNVAAQAW